MKKQIVALVLIGSLAMATGAAAACGKQGKSGSCPQKQGQYQQLDQETKDKLSQFFKDNQALVKEMAMKRAEKRALMKSDNPNPQVAAKVTGELFDLKVALGEKAEAAGLKQYVGHGPMGMGGHGGPGKQRGKCMAGGDTAQQ